MTKEEKIKQVIDIYYSKYPDAKLYADSNGYFAITNGYTSNLKAKVKDLYNLKSPLLDFLIDGDDFEEYYSHFRPKELSDLIDEVEKNNGWTKIESENDLPKDKTLCYRMYVEGLKKAFDGFWDGTWCYYPDGKTGSIYELKCVTHYKILIEEPKPIY